MPPEGLSAPEGVEVLGDGRIRVAWSVAQPEGVSRQVDFILRRPLVEEWLSYLEEGDAADAWRPLDEDNNPRPRRYRDLLGSDNPYRGLMARVFEELGGATLAREELPVWCSDGRIMGTLAEVWLSVPTIRSAPPR